MRSNPFHHTLPYDTLWYPMIPYDILECCAYSVHVYIDTVPTQVCTHIRQQVHLRSDTLFSSYASFRSRSRIAIHYFPLMLAPVSFVSVTHLHSLALLITLELLPTIGATKEPQIKFNPRGNNTKPELSAVPALPCVPRSSLLWAYRQC
jgi:hypothetical protein